MKLRNGFVSNSSSSSFVIAFNKKPTSRGELLDILFPWKKDGRDGVCGWDDEGVDAGTAATLIWQQLEDQKPLTKTEIFKEIRDGWFEGHPELSWSNLEEDRIREEYREISGKDIYDKDADPDWRKKYDKAHQTRWAEYEKAIDVAAKELFDRIYPMKFKGKKCFVVSFSDNDGQTFATLEHGDTFRNIPHTTISHH